MFRARRWCWLAILSCALHGCDIDWTVPQPPAGTGGAGGGGGPGQGGGGASQSAESSSSSAGGAALCDGSGDCTTCINCVVASACSGEFGACQSDQLCSQIVNCATTTCGTPEDVACVQRCVAQNPDGEPLFLALAQCVCMTCPGDCASAAPLCR